MSDLTRFAQAVMLAATNGNTNVINDPVYKQCIAAALRVAADHIEAESIWIGHAEHSAVRWSAHELRRLVAELEGATAP